MYKLTIMYPYQQGKRFDMDYYCNVHMMDPNDVKCRGAQIEMGICGMDEEVPPKYFCIAHSLYDTLKDLQTYFEANKKALFDDIPNFTDVQPEFQISVETMNLVLPNRKSERNFND
ncbi:EthD family reductase [Lactonifactor longoviformis]|uniref:EthD domain-containing protein n=1 Tax=Lactonifactor longoviformis DSM 17459 TaxID=1122155 RepID=A0A1M4URX2_9CLOT|nr:EthD family reductase [Lactonifactor longoviformis]SHE59373.1 conserved hypothetical protein [Lactonifactor longoviformis DSM 17459]